LVSMQIRIPLFCHCGSRSRVSMTKHCNILQLEKIKHFFKSKQIAFFYS
jgi:hypothetical protein